MDFVAFSVSSLDSLVEGSAVDVGSGVGTGKEILVFSIDMLHLTAALTKSRTNFGEI